MSGNAREISLAQKFKILSILILPGLYHVRVSLIDIDLRSRLTVFLPDGSETDYFIGGEITVN